MSWDAKRSRFIAKDDAGEVLGVSTDQSNAIGSAVREANTASHSGSKIIVQVVGKDGKAKTEYTAQPPLPRQPQSRKKKKASPGR